MEVNPRKSVATLEWEKTVNAHFNNCFHCAAGPFYSHAGAQSPPQPLYRMTIVSRTTKAINYGYLTAPTRVDFQGTPVLPYARGEAVVEPKRGATLLKIKFDNVPPPSRFGPQYLTYVVWAISSGWSRPEPRRARAGRV